MQITHVYNNQLVLNNSGNMITIEHLIDNGKLSNTDYIMAGDIYVNQKVLVSGTRIDAAKSVLEIFFDDSVTSEMAYKILSNYNIYAGFSSTCKRLLDFWSKDDLNIMTEFLNHVSTTSYGITLTNKKATYLARTWLLRVVFRDICMLGYSAKSCVFNQHPGFGDICKFTNASYDIFTLQNNHDDLYKMYWLYPKSIYFLENAVGIRRNEFLYSIYLIAHETMKELRNNTKPYISYQPYEHLYLTNFPNLSDFGISVYNFSTIQDNYNICLNFTLNIPRRVISMIESSKPVVDIDNIDEYIQEYENIIGSSFDVDQIHAINTAIISKSGAISIQGMPGTGKSTITGCIIYILQKFDMEYKIFAPTGKAASRINSILAGSNLSVEATTCHSFFCTSTKSTMKDRGLFIDAIIFDESSMLSFEVLYCTIRNLKFGKIIFVGDINQIPCVRSIDCFTTIMNKYEVCNLTTVHRNKLKDFNNHFLDESTFKTCLHYPDMISIGLIVDDDYLSKFYIDIASKNIDEKFYNLAYSNGFDHSIDTLSNAVITYRNETRKRLTNNIRTHLNRFSDFEVGEPMMILNNDYDNNIMNGDIFIIVKAINNIRLCYFPTYNKEINLDLDYLNDNSYYSYVITYHKSEGSEWDNIIIYVDSMQRQENNNDVQYLNRNLVYTGINRAKKYCYIQLHNKSMVHNKLYPAILTDYSNII